MKRPRRLTGMTTQMGFKEKYGLGLKLKEKKGKHGKIKAKYQKLKFQIQTKLILLPNQKCTCSAMNWHLTEMSVSQGLTGLKK